MLYTTMKTILLFVLLTVGSFAAETPKEQVPPKRQGIDLLTADYVRDGRGNVIAVTPSGTLPLEPRPEKQLEPKGGAGG